MENFKDRYGPVSLVTGASSGIGTGFAEELAARGMDLVLAARRVDRLEDLKVRLEAEHDVSVQVMECDLADLNAPARLAEACAKYDIGLVVSNAGFGAKGWFEQIDAALVAEMLTVNCHAQMQIAHGFLPRLKARGRGGLLMVSSVEGLMGGPFSAAYAATKALVVALGEGLWGELQGTGVDVLTLTPGATESEAAAKQGFDPAKMTNVQPARECAALALDNLANGPTFCPNPHYRALFERMTAMPRQLALLAMAQGMRPKD
ncbi:SDR family NAD(P)-dependent oxidoreductase [Novosphingobium aquae]|uniref:SDR family NAD(P)-dependent oxidoreductase n=1 Tax=Novosphingobium aquae TaxID=3133435 RepID=A0ABU8S813_9SPHN